MISYSRAWLKDKIHACFIGKKIGGTIGASYEGCRELVRRALAAISEPGRVFCVVRYLGEGRMQESTALVVLMGK